MSGISFNGLASGINTGEMIEKLMQLERIPYNKLGEKKTKLSDEQGIIRSLNTKLVTLRSAISELMYTSAYNLTSAKTSDSTAFSVSSSEQAATGSYNVEVTQLAKKHVVSSTEFNVNDPSDTSLTSLVGQTFQLYGKGGADPKTIKLEGETSKEILTNLKDSINNAKLGVSASIVETSPGKQSLVLTSDKFGENADIRFGAMPDPADEHVYISGDDALLKSLGVMKSDDTINTRQAAQNAIAEVNGITINSSTNELKDVLPGVTLTLLKENTSGTISVTKDTDKVADKVQAFVDAYNDAITLIRSSSAQEAKMQGDSTLRMLQSELNDMVSGAVKGGGAFKYLFEIGLEIDKGITSGKAMTGKLSFDKSKFAEAFNKDPESVYKLFASDEGEKNREKGVSTRLYNMLYNWTRTGTGLLAYKISGYDADIKAVTQQMTDMDMRLKMKEKQLQSQFTAMEKALSSLQNQQSWLSNQINALSY
ncbi:flagellar filament capping protein FliD [Cohnella hongkongensis]|uniref:Flagellar hook-associated protein 2 n=1 Tax=Cohnella hongkongensis TaxID=178337 RepID=A0ABV9FFX8_9BACL